MFITGGASPFWQKTISGARAAAKDHDAEIKIVTPDGGANGQLQQLMNVDVKDLDGLAISPLDPAALTERLSEMAKSIKLVTYDSDAPNSNRLCYIGTNNFAAGKLCARMVKDALPEGGKIVVLFANSDKDNAVHRHEGFIEELNRTSGETEADTPRYEVLATLHDNIDAERCAANIKQALTDYADINCFVGMFGYHGAALLETLSTVESTQSLKLIVFDEDERVLQGIADGTIYGTIVQDPYKYGYEAVRMLTALHAGRNNELPIADRGSLFLPCELVTKKNLSEFRARLNKRIGHDNG